MGNRFNKLINMDYRKIPYYLEVLAQISIRKVLSFLFKFDKWHIVPPARKPYLKDTIKYLNEKREKESCVDIGCGLGYILRHVKFNKRVGLDIDDNVLGAASFLSWITFNKKIEFKKFQFPVDILKEKFDAILLFGICHIIEPNNLKLIIQDYFQSNLNNNGCLIIEIVHYQDKRIYPYNHEISFLTKDIRCNLTRIGVYEPEKEIWVIIKGMTENS